MQRAEIGPLTGLRAIAAIYVFMFHMMIRWPYLPNGFASNVISQGAIGMSIFFMLSGFVLTYQYGNRKFIFREYVVNRFARIYPIYVLCALFSIAWIGIPISGHTPIQTAKNLTQIFVLVSSNIFLIQAWFPPFFNYWNNGGSWSISVEAFLYLALPMLIPSLVSLSKNKLLAIAITAYIVAVLPGLVYVLWSDSMPLDIFYMMPIFRLPEFIIGICACLFLRSTELKMGRSAMAFLSLIALVTYLGNFGPHLTGYTAHDWIVLPAVAMVIVTLASGGGFAARIMSSKTMVWLGKISYCIYSLQIFIIQPLIRHHDEIVGRIPVLRHNAVLLAASFALLIFGSSIAHHLIEEPTRRWISKRYGSGGTGKHIGEQAVNQPAS